MDIKNTIAVFGANGFIGSAILQTIIAEPGYRNVLGVVRSDSARKSLAPFGASVVITPDYEQEAIFKTLRQHQVDVVVYTIGTIGRDKEAMNDANYEILKRCVSAAEQTGVRHLIYFSGLGVSQYGIKEWATNMYFRTKHLGEQILQKSDLTHTILRPTYVFGPETGIISKIIEAIQYGTYKYVDRRERPFRPIWIDDVVTAVRKLCENVYANENLENRTYDLVGPEALTLPELVTRVFQLMKVRNLDRVNSIAFPTLNPLSLHDASEILELSQSQLGVSLCDVVGDPISLTQNLNFRLTPLTRAIEACISGHFA